MITPKFKVSKKKMVPVMLKMSTEISIINPLTTEVAINIIKDTNQPTTNIKSQKRIPNLKSTLILKMLKTLKVNQKNPKLKKRVIQNKNKQLKSLLVNN